MTLIDELTVVSALEGSIIRKNGVDLANIPVNISSEGFPNL